MGLLLMRLALSGGLLARCLSAWPAEAILPIALYVESLAAALLCVGLATPIWGAGLAAVELYRAYSNPEQLLVHLLLATIGSALALLGPGAFSVDARVFGWRRITLPPKGSRHDSN